MNQKCSDSVRSCHSYDSVANTALCAGEVALGNRPGLAAAFCLSITALAQKQFATGEVEDLCCVWDPCQKKNDSQMLAFYFYLFCWSSIPRREKPESIFKKDTVLSVE